MARTKKRVELINITEATTLYGLHRWQIRDVAHRHHLQPQSNPSHPDRRCKWYPRALLAAAITLEYSLPLAS